MSTTEQIWLRVKKRIQSKLKAGEFRTWFSEASLEKLEGDSAVIIVPNRFHALWLTERYLSVIEKCLADTVAGSPKVSFSYEQVSQDAAEDLPGLGCDLDPSMTFAEAQTGEWNRFAFSSAMQVTERESRDYSPLYIYSTPGLGKTHLLHAVGNRIQSENPGLAARYVPSVLFATEFNRYYRKDQYQSFEGIYGSTDVLLFDDVHLLSRRTMAQNGLLLMFDSLYSRGKRMVFTADRAAHELTGISDPLKSRLAWGVLAEIRMPTQNALMEIIRRRERENDLHLPEDVLFFLSHASRDIKALCRNIRKLKTCLSPKGGQINVSMAMSLIKGSDAPVGIENIKSVIAGYFNIPLQELSSGGRKRSCAYPRQVAMYLARKYTDLSFKEIGDSFGHKDHSTVIHAIRRIEERREQERSTTDDLSRIENLIL